MAKVTITGASDDLIEIGGDIVEEFNYPFFRRDEESAGRLLAFSDGTLLRIIYDRDGIWRITPLIYGTARYSKQDGCKDTDTFDVVSLQGEIKWVCFGEAWSR